MSNIGEKALNALKRMEYFVNEDMGIKTFKQSGWHIEGSDDYEIVKDALLKYQELEKTFDDHLVFNDGHIMSGFVYKGHQIVALPLDEYSKLMDLEKENQELLQSLSLKSLSTIIQKSKDTDEKENDEYKETLDIIFTKNVNIIKLKFYTMSDPENALDRYNTLVAKDMVKQLTQEEFLILKRYIINVYLCHLK